MTFKTRHLEVIFSDSTKPSANFVVNPRVKALLGAPQLMVKFQIEKQVSSEPNSANLIIHGLGPLHAKALDFVFDLFSTKFGATCIINGGFLETGINQLYTGVITNAVSVREGAEFVTKISIRNNYIELMRRPVRFLAHENRTSKATALLGIIQTAGGKISTEQQNQILTRLGKDFYSEDEIIQGTLSQVLADFNKSLTPKIAIYWDDAGVNFTPPGAFVEGRIVKSFSEKNGLIGNPEPTSSGLNFSLELNGSLRISDPVQIFSDVTNRLLRSVGGITTTAIDIAFKRIGVTSLYKIIHTGDNREGEFKTMCESKFVDILRQSGA